ncbi:MAG: hypothetical protein PVG22_20090 [Chromatiales bacterium]|jgi:hypothetical protein
MACFLLARMLKTAGGAQQALPLLEEAQQGFEAIVQERGNKEADLMVSLCFEDSGSVFSTWVGTMRLCQPLRNAFNTPNNWVMVVRLLLAKVVSAMSF